MRIGDKLILLRKILSFAAIAKSGNVTAAALENGMKQSNLSGYVKELEEKEKKAREEAHYYAGQKKSV